MGLRGWVYKKTGICLKKRSCLDKRARMLNMLKGDSSLGKYSYMQGNSSFFNVHIGCYCSIAPNVTIGDIQHPISWLSTHPFQYIPSTKFKTLPYEGEPHKNNQVIVGNDVWICRHAVILTGVQVGDGAIVGAGAVVTKNVPPYAIVGGNPARIIRYRFDEKTITELLSLAWWQLEPEDMDGVNFANIHEAILQIKQIKMNKQRRLPVT
ncbi:MAG: CatB-related O-acetyltransferase [Deltaproteobacteria bacterium]|nr:CatB-related O-acetyltransferase [Deltaproteobacteria bacterium]